MNNDFDIDVIEDDKYKKPKIVIYAPKDSEDTKRIIDSINSSKEYGSLYISAYLDDKVEMVEKSNILRIKRDGRKVVLETNDKSYVVKKTLTQLEDELDNKRFIRISQSEIINVYKVKNLDISVVGTIIIEFDNGVKSHVSRRFVKSVKDFFEN